MDLPLPAYTVSMDAPRLWALVPCAGVGARSGLAGPKQYHPVAGRPVVAHTLGALAHTPGLAATLVVLAPDDELFETLVGTSIPVAQGHAVHTARCGGASRAETVANGLQALAELGAAGHDWVLVHDAARCLVEPAWITRLIAACGEDEVGGLLAQPLADTLKQALPADVAGALPQAGTARVAATVDRQSKWAAQTPQMFRLALLQRALAQALSDPGLAITDEASAVEALGHAPLLVPGHAMNLKLTWPEDFALAERWLRSAA